MKKKAKKNRYRKRQRFEKNRFSKKQRFTKNVVFQIIINRFIIVTIITKKKLTQIMK